MNRDQKATVVEELAGQLNEADAVFAVDYRGISVSQAAELRNRLREAQARFRVVKNSLTERATDAAGVPELKPMLEGPTALAFVTGDPALAAKALNDASRIFGALEFKGGLLDGSSLTADDVRSIARLPAREVLHGQLVGTIAAPLSGLVRTLNALIAGLAIQLQQVAEQGLVSGEAASGVATETEAEAEAAPSEPESVPAGDAAAAPEAEAPTEDAAAQAPEAEAPAEEAAPQEPEQPETEAPDAEASED